MRLADYESVEVPRERAECIRAPRPCPLRCRYRLDGPISCALDVVDLMPDGATLDAIGAIVDLSWERVRQVEAGAFAKLRRTIPRTLGISAEEWLIELRAPVRTQSEPVEE